MDWMNTDPAMTEQVAEVLDPHPETRESGVLGAFDSHARVHARHDGELNTAVRIEEIRIGDAGPGYRFRDVPPA